MMKICVGEFLQVRLAAAGCHMLPHCSTTSHRSGFLCIFLRSRPQLGRVGPVTERKGPNLAEPEALLG